ncbi:hypothetical protein CHISP_1716 [Chitinispirillum alkaliphilum]|nr:hypothetical protein CHISP_1716 [Chitinispirillum alkaliphilum]
MKTALITHHRIPNFGANLQALATHSLLRQSSDTVVLNYAPEKLELRYQQICNDKQIQAHLQFAEEFLHLSPILRNEDDIYSYCKSEKIDCIISGSDSIFRLTKELNTHEGGFPNPYWLNWAKKRKDYQPITGFISGSATGSSYYSFPRHLKESIVNELEKADYISVRDKWTRMMFAFISNGRIRPRVTPDPVFILNESVSFPEIYTSEAHGMKGSYILYSARNGRVSNDWLRKFVSLCHNKGYKVFGLCLPESIVEYNGFDKNIGHPLSPAEWYSWIANAAGVVGERFHLAVSAIANNVPLVSIDHYRKEGLKNKFTFINFPATSKVYSLLKQAKIASYCIHYRELKRLSPEMTLKLLTTFPRSDLESFSGMCNDEFKGAVQMILSSKKS